MYNTTCIIVLVTASAWLQACPTEDDIDRVMTDINLTHKSFQSTIGAPPYNSNSGVFPPPSPLPHPDVPTVHTPRRHSASPDAMILQSSPRERCRWILRHGRFGAMVPFLQSSHSSIENEHVATPRLQPPDFPPTPLHFNATSAPPALCCLDSVSPMRTHRAELKGCRGTGHCVPEHHR